MAGGILKALIVYDKADKAKQIEDALPDYFLSTITNYNNAKDTLLSLEGDVFDVIIMNADDTRDCVMDFYMYLCKDPEELYINRIPVVLITKDEFSEHSMSFYDAGNPFFYTGDIHDVDFYLQVVEAIEEAELLEDEDYEEEEDFEVVDNSVSQAISVNKLIGTSVSVKGGEDEPARIATFNAAETLKKIARIVGKNKEAAKQVVEVLNNAAAARNVKQQNLFIMTDDLGNRKMPQKPDVKPAAPANIVKQGIEANKPKQTGPKTIVIVDTDPMTLRAFKLFVGEDVVIEQVDSSMKAIDYFVKNKADAVVVEYDMPILRGLQIINSIRMQPNGRTVRAAVLMSNERTPSEHERVLYTDGIAGVINKPIVKKQMLPVVQRLLL